MSYYDVIHSILIRFVGNAVVQIGYSIHTRGVSGYPTRAARSWGKSLTPLVFLL